MLLDKYVLTKGLSTLLSRSPAFPHNHTAHGSFTKRVQASMARLDPLLKVLQVRPSPPEGLVQAYLIHIGDKSEANFRKVLELKGVRKFEQPALVELFIVHRDSPRSTGGPELVNSSPLMAAVVLGGDAKSAITAASTITGNLNTRFDAGTFGEKLFSAARDGVERMGSTSSPIIGAGPGRDGSVERQSLDAAGNRAGSGAMNENLRNFGKFFRRDMSGFGGRFGKGTGGADDTVR